uniref:Transmembrane protein 38B n=1 Tax=Laticauda laticaudata TaxID=8630 RepID=A0A8C5SVL2_LATLA
FTPIRLMIAGMKEVTRTWKITGGIVHAHKRFADAWLIMIGVGWARGAGGGLISNFEQLVRGIWKPETNELLKMSYPVKVSLIGAVLFTMQCNFYLPITKNNLMLLYTMFLVVTKVSFLVSMENQVMFPSPTRSPSNSYLSSFPWKGRTNKEMFKIPPWEENTFNTRMYH